MDRTPEETESADEEHEEEQEGIPSPEATRGIRCPCQVSPEEDGEEIEDPEAEG